MDHQWILTIFLSMLVTLNVPHIAQTVSSESRDMSVTSVVLVGALGDLAKKYLWQGLFDLYLVEETTSHTFNFVAVGRKSLQEGNRLLVQILDNHIRCSDSDTVALTTCNTNLQTFKSLVQYKQLMKMEDYAAFCGGIADQIDVHWAKEAGRLFYLSVPPFAYAGIAENIHKGCRPPEGDTWLRVVLEKPFGHDLKSAHELANKLSGFLKEEEIYRVDHYLGKVGVQSILPFRHLNEARYGRLWNGDHIARVEIVMKETIDVKGRLEFYDSYGVIRDVMQNHLTEIAALIGMETPRNISNHQDTLTNKLRFLRQVKPIGIRQAVIGQYDGYVKQWREELIKSVNESVHTPTFAAVALYITNPQWRDVPFVMTAGKSLDERIGYVRVLFHDNNVCLKKRSEDNLGQCGVRQVIFVTGNPGRKYPSILVSTNLPEPEMPSPWRKGTGFAENFSILGFPSTEFNYFSRPEDVSPYTDLISSCFYGNKDKFVGTQDLMASWEIWTPLINGIVGKSPRVYPGGDASGNWLNFKISQKKLYFLHDVNEDEWKFSNQGSFSTVNVVTISDTYRSRPLVTGMKNDVIERLAVHLRHVAGESIHKRGSFHLALSGGKTPQQLLAYLALRMNLEFPWHKTHIWQVDERCVSKTDEHSNFAILHDSLLHYIQIPHINVHPMPIEILNGLCSQADRGSLIYESELKRTVPDGRLDYVLLGMGTDGHTASLFPNQTVLDNGINLVAITDGGPPGIVPRRMTLTYRSINAARHAGVLVTGKDKRPIVSFLKSKGVADKLQYPITGVQLTDGDLVWYIDHEALL